MWKFFRFKNAKVCLQILDQLQQREKARLIINKNVSSLIKVKDFENMFDSQVFGVVSNDIKTANICLNKGQPIVISMPKTPIAKEMTAIAQKLIIKA